MTISSKLYIKNTWSCLWGSQFCNCILRGELHDHITTYCKNTMGTMPVLYTVWLICVLRSNYLARVPYMHVHVIPSGKICCYSRHPTATCTFRLVHCASWAVLVNEFQNGTLSFSGYKVSKFSLITGRRCQHNHPRSTHNLQSQKKIFGHERVQLLW